MYSSGLQNDIEVFYLVVTNTYAPDIANEKDISHVVTPLNRTYFAFPIFFIFSIISQAANISAPPAIGLCSKYKSTLLILICKAHCRSELSAISIR